MTQGQQPEALRLAEQYDYGDPATHGNAWKAAVCTELRRQHARIAELESELEAVGAGGVQALSAAPAGWKAVPVNPTPEMWRAAKSVPDPNPPYPPHYGLVWDAMLAATPTPPAEQQAAPKAAPGDAIDEAMRERDDAVDFIDALLDEVLGHERPEWSNLYGRADALNDVQERMTALHKPAVDKAWGRFQSAMAAPQQEAQEPVAWQGVHDQTDLYYTKPAQADVRPLYTTTQPAPAAQGDALDAALTWTVFNSGVDIEKAEAELRRLHAENTALQHGYDTARMEIDGLRDRVQELGAMLRENCNRRIVELEAQLEAIGAGGVEPLRRRECLHQISEPVPPESITDQEIYRIAESIPGGLDGFLKGWGWRQFARAVLEHSTRKAEAANPGFLTGFNEINGLPAGEYPAPPEPRPIPGFYDLKERSALRYTAQDLIAYVDADRAARAQPADPWREALLDACMPTEACFDGGNPAKTVNNLIDWHLQNERYHVAQRAQPAVAQAAPAAVAGPEHELKDVRCECCGYMTYHREHMGCIRAAYAARAAAPTTQEAPQPAAPQGDALTLADAAQLEKVIDDFCDCGETDVPYEALQRFAAMGYLECVHYNVLPAAREAIDAARSQAKEGANHD